MSEEQQGKQESQKTLIAFVAGLLIGGLLVWVFGGTSEEKKADMDTESTNTQQETPAETEDDALMEGSATVSGVTTTLQTGDGSVSVDDHSAGSTVTLESATFPTDEGWVGVRTYTNGQLGSLLGVSRYSNEQGLIPTEVYLQSPTRSGNAYAVVFYTENGDREFNLANDMQIEGIAGTFTAQ